MPFLVLCAACRFVPNPDAGGGAVACELVHRQDFGTRPEADAYARDIWYSPAPWGRHRNSPEDVIELVEVGSDGDAAVARWLNRLSEDSQIREKALHIHRYWIAGKNPYDVSLAEARAYQGSDAIAMLEGDDGGQTYVVCPVALIRCDEPTLRQLLLDIDSVEWGEPDMVKLCYLRRAVGEHVGGGMGWRPSHGGVWVHRTLRDRGLEPQILAVLAGEHPTLG